MPSFRGKRGTHNNDYAVLTAAGHNLRGPKVYHNSSMYWSHKPSYRAGAREACDGRLREELDVNGLRMTQIVYKDKKEAEAEAKTAAELKRIQLAAKLLEIQKPHLAMPKKNGEAEVTVAVVNPQLVEDEELEEEDEVLHTAVVPEIEQVAADKAPQRRRRKREVQVMMPSRRAPVTTPTKKPAVGKPVVVKDAGVKKTVAKKNKVVPKKSALFKALAEAANP